MWFCLQKKFFDPPEDQSFVPQLTNKDEQKGKVSTTLVDVYKQGKDKVTQNFGRKLFSAFKVLSDVDIARDRTEEQEEC